MKLFSEVNTVDEIKALKELMCDDALIPLEQNNGKYYCTLPEPESDYVLTIKQLSENAIIIKCDKFPPAKDFFRGTKNECKRADYIIVLDEPKRILYIELKRSKNSSSNQEIIAQLKGAKCVINYCNSIMKSFWDTNGLDDYDDRYFKYISRSINKRGSRPTATVKNNTPNDARIIHDSSVFLQKLLK